MSTSSSKHDPGGSVIPTTCTQLLAVTDVLDAPRISRSSVSFPKVRTRKPLPANARIGHAADANSGFPDVVCWCIKQWSCKSVLDHRSDRDVLAQQLIARIDKADRDHENVLIYRVDSGDRNAAPLDKLIMRTVAQRIAPVSRIRQGASSCWTTRYSAEFGNRTGRAPSGQGKILKPWHVRHSAQAQTGSARGCGTYSSVEPGVRARSQAFSPAVSVLTRIMLESHQAPMPAHTRRRPIWHQPDDVTSVVRPLT